MPFPRRERKSDSSISAQVLDLAAATAVALLDARPQQMAVGIEQDDGGQHSGHADRRESVGKRRRTSASVRGDFADVGPPFRRIFFGPADMVRAQGNRPRGEGER